MKKIGILTFHRSINYGAYMQSFALSRYIQNLYPQLDVEIIDYASEIMNKHYKPKISLAYIKHPILFFKIKKQYNKFSNALNYLTLSNQTIINDKKTDEVLSYIAKQYDIVIVGSDAVWNWIKRGFPNPYILNFHKKVIKLSYAASAYGMSMDYLSDQEKEYFKQSLEKFSFIGTRDEYTKKLVQDICPTSNPVFTCDPTVLLDIEQVKSILKCDNKSYKDYIYKKYNLPINKKIIGVMGTSNELIRQLKKKYHNSYSIVCLYTYMKEADYSLIDLDPLEWSLVFTLFDITITNYFHGTLLSLKNRTPVITLDFTDFSKKNEGKIHDIMRRMELLEYHFENKKNINENWEDIIEKVNSILINKERYKDKIDIKLSELKLSSEKFFSVLGELI